MVLGLFLITPSQADDIRDFQIEGISIGNSLLDFFSKEEIKINLRKDYYQYKSNKKFVAVEFYQFPFFNTYDGVQFHVKSNDKKYIIYSITGYIFYDENIDDCYKKLNEIDKEFSNIFKDAKREDMGIKKHPKDKSGKSTAKEIFYWFKTGERTVIDCYDWSSEMKGNDSLGVSLDAKEFVDWLNE